MRRFFNSSFFILFFVLFFLINCFIPSIAAYASGVGAGLDSGADIGGSATPYRRDENYVDVQPGDVDIWDNGEGISVSGGGQVLSVAYQYNHYAAFVSKYLDSDGEYTLEVDILMYNSRAYVYPEGTSVSDDGSVYFNVRFANAPNSMFSTYQGYEYTVKLRDGNFMVSSGEWKEEPAYFYGGSAYVKGVALSSAKFYVSPYYNGKYKVYSSSEYVESGCEGFPVNLLPNAPMGAGSTNIPYKTTFRMLSGDATVYNTIYYTSSYMSGTDEISASGTIRLDATKLADGTVTRTRPSAPQLLCQVSSYGKAYDIVYTNDDNLLSLLGIDRPPERYWDVENQRWVLFIPTLGPSITPSPSVTPLPGTTPSGSTWLDTGKSIWDNFPSWLQIKQGFTKLDDEIRLGVGTLWGKVVDGLPVAGEAWYNLLDDYFKCFSYNEAEQRFSTFAPNLPDGWEPLPDASIVDALTDGFTARFAFDPASDSFVWQLGAVAGSVPGINLGLQHLPGTGTTVTPPPGVTPGGGGTGTPGSGDTTIGGGVVDTIEGIASMAKEIVQAFKQLLANIGEMGSIVKILFGFLPPEMIGFIRITIYGCLFVAFYKALKG